MTRKDSLVGRAPEPEQPQRRLDDGVRRHARVGGVAMLVSPVGRAGQRSLARQEQPLSRKANARAGHLQLLDKAAELLLFCQRNWQAGHSSIGSQRMEYLANQGGID